MILPAIFYIAWDALFTSLGVWGFNEKYISGIHLFNLPIEEVLFFFVVPYCCVFVFECIRSYFPHLKDTHSSRNIFLSLGVLLFIIGLIFHAKYYTAFTFIFTAFFIVSIYLLRNYFRHFNTASFLISYAIILIPFLVVNGFLTAIPVVVYNDAENLGIRIYSIPVEDVFYGMLLMMMNVAGYERLQKQSSSSK